MSTFTYHKPGIGNASSYIVSGTPWYTSSLAPALSTTSTVINLPRVTNSITIKNTSTTGDVLRFTLNDDNIVDNTNYITLEDGESFSAELRVVDVQLISDTETPVPFTILAGLTNIDRKEMYGKVPSAPNLLAWVQKQKLIADDPDGSPEGDKFGYPLSFCSANNLIAITAKQDEENGSFAGAAYIFHSGSTGYQQVQKLTASGEADPAGDFLGTSISISATGDVVAIGAAGDEENGGAGAGAAYIFHSGSTGYQQVQKLTASGEADPAGYRFGQAVAINSSGNIVAIGADGDEENGGANAGAVYIFQSGSAGYQQVQKLTASGEVDPAGDWFGQAVAINSSGNIVAIGAYSNEEKGSFAGAAYIFQSGSTGYQQAQKLTASLNTDGSPEIGDFDFFGADVSLNSAGNIVAIGAWGDGENGGFAGAAYIFQSGSAGYQQVQKLTASGEVDPANDFLGTSVSLNSAGDVLAVGANNNKDAGAVYIFQSSGSGYQQIHKLTASFNADGSPETDVINDNFGAGVVLNSAADVVVIGSFTDTENGTDGTTYGGAGAAYIFKYTRDY